MRSIQGGKRGTYSRARTSYVDGTRGKGSDSSGQKGLGSGGFNLGAPQDYGIIQQLGVHSRQYLDVRHEDEVGHSDLVLRPPFRPHVAQMQKDNSSN